MATFITTVKPENSTDREHLNHVKAVLEVHVAQRLSHYEPFLSEPDANGVIGVSMRQDPVPGWGHEPSHHTELVTSVLAEHGVTARVFTSVA